MPTEIVVALIAILPGLLAGIVLLMLILVFRKPIVDNILPNLSGLKILGVEIVLLKKSLDDAATKMNVTVSEGDKWSALKRVRHVSPVLRGARVLWVDDDHPRNEELINMLSKFMVTVDKARDTEEAIKLLGRHQYHLIISDIKRGTNRCAGIDMVEELCSKRIYRWTIFYVEKLEPGMPKNAFNITNRPDHLLHLVMDVLERERWE